MRFFCSGCKEWIPVRHRDVPWSKKEHKKVHEVFEHHPDVVGLDLGLDFYYGDCGEPPGVAERRAQGQQPAL